MCKQKYNIIKIIIERFLRYINITYRNFYMFNLFLKLHINPLK